MISTVEISLYPNSEEFIPPIKRFIARLNEHPEFEIQTFPTATIVMGEHDALMDMLAEETKAHREEFGMSIFVMKLLPDYQAL